MITCKKSKADVFLTQSKQLSEYEDLQNQEKSDTKTAKEVSMHFPRDIVRCTCVLVSVNILSRCQCVRTYIIVFSFLQLENKVKDLVRITALCCHL